ncbi:MAG: DegT/DnrJ/EryC1/StrS aminotransferase family protein [Ruminococcaceae bacterium]|nr:DegT/DnrJ/EryC1/StrS aminotransferase family protein [Oscillospiraceae bacterium]
MEKRKIDFSPPDISEKEIELVAEALRSGWITTGPKTKQFEKEVAEFCGTSRAAALNSQTACAEMTLRLLGIGEGDEVIVPAYTYTASASIVCHVGAKLVICDVSDTGFEMDYDKMEGLITPKTKAVIPVDLAGIMCDYKKIYEIIERKKHLFEPENKIQEAMGRIAVCADGAHSFGACQNGRRSGSVADFTSFSFHAVKNLTTAEGGAVTWRDIEGIDNEDIYKQYMLLSLHGQSKDALAKTRLGSWEYDIVAPNYKCNMTDVHAAIGLAQLERYEEILMKREKFIKMYNEGLKDTGVGFLNHYDVNHKSSGHLYLCNLTGKDEEYRNLFIEKMAERGIATNVHYKPLPMLTAYKNLGFDICDFPNAYDRYHNEVSLPLNTKMTEQDVEYVIENFKEIWGK